MWIKFLIFNKKFRKCNMILLIYLANNNEKSIINKKKCSLYLYHKSYHNTPNKNCKKWITSKVASRKGNSPPWPPKYEPAWASSTRSKPAFHRRRSYLYRHHYASRSSLYSVLARRVRLTTCSL